MNDDDEAIARELEIQVELAEEVVRGFDGTPILQRLKFVQSILFNRDGDKGSLPVDPVSVIATELITSVIAELEAPTAPRRLRTRSKENAPSAG